MVRYLFKRVTHAVVVLWATFTAAFFLLYVLPGDAALLKLNLGGGSSSYSAEELAKLRTSLGLDLPVLIQYGRSLWAAFHGNFGISVQTGRDALGMFAEGLPETLKLAVVALVIGLALGIGVALIAAYVQWPPAKRFFLSLPAVGVSMPPFWVGLILLQILSFKFQLLPGMGNDGLATLVLPSLVLAVPTAALAAQILSRSLSSAFASPYIETARSRGANRLRLLLGHALRNSIIPVVTALALTSGRLIAGSVVVETVFSRSGIGLTTVKAVLFQDTPIVLVAVLFAAAVFVTINLLVDLFYPLIDPRINIGVRDLATVGA